MAEKKPGLTRGQRAKLRRLEKDGYIKHRWGDKWDYVEAVEVLRKHEAGELKKEEEKKP